MSEPAGVELPTARRRLLGIALIGLFGLALTGAHLWRWQHRGAGDLTQAYRELAAAVAHPTKVDEHARRAQELLAQASGGVLMNPEALVALQLAEQLPHQIGQPAPSPPVGVEVAAVARHTEQLLTRGRVTEANDYLRRPEVARMQEASLRVLKRVSERWQAALRQQD